MTDFDNQEHFIEGKFIEELKNRFLCSVEINGIPETCYVPSSSRMDNYIDLCEKHVLLSRNKSPKSKTDYSLYAVKEQDNWILLNTNMVNGLFLPWITEKNPDSIIIPEYQVSESYRCDYYVSSEHSKKIIEIKSILSTEMHIRYPKVWSQRLLRQLNDIYSLLKQGIQVDLYFAVLNATTTTVTANHDLGDIRDALKKCIQNGLNVLYFNVLLKPYKNIEISQRLGNVDDLL